MNWNKIIGNLWIADKRNLIDVLFSFSVRQSNELVRCAFKIDKNFLYRISLSNSNVSESYLIRAHGITLQRYNTRHWLTSKFYCLAQSYSYFKTHLYHNDASHPENIQPLLAAFGIPREFDLRYASYAIWANAPADHELSPDWNHVRAKNVTESSHLVTIQETFKATDQKFRVNNDSVQSSTFPLCEWTNDFFSWTNCDSCSGVNSPKYRLM